MIELLQVSPFLGARKEFRELLIGAKNAPFTQILKKPNFLGRKTLVLFKKASF